MNILIHPSYFPNIASFVGMANSSETTFEIHDNYQKQTYRNRTHIYSANGKLALHIPIHFSQNNRQLYKDVKIADDGKWQLIHWKSLQSAYSTSPFFEYYKDDLAPLFHEKQDYIMAFNMKCLTVILDCIQMDLNYILSNNFEKNTEHVDLRFLINAKNENEFQINSYTQVFTNNHGFISNLSILDLLFNVGPNTLNYLQEQTLEGL